MSSNEEIGKMNRRVSVCVPVNDKSAMGAPVKAFAHSLYMYASRKLSGSGNEQYVNQRLVTPYSYTYKAHYRGPSVLNETMRIVDEGVTYNILSVNADDMKMFIEIFVEKVTE